MPNGDPVQWNKEFPKVEAFFSKISNVLQEFASSHNLMIKKYYHEGADWTFLFRHPEGGVGQIFAIKEGEEHVGVAGIWYVDDYDALTRYLKHAEVKKCSLEKPTLLALLNETFKLVLSWRKEDLASSGGKYNEWKKHPRETIEGHALEYPIPKLD